MPPDLTDQQRQALHETNDAGPVTVVEPATHTQYVLVRADIFQELQHGTRDLETPGRLSSRRSYHGGR